MLSEKADGKMAKAGLLDQHITEIRMSTTVYDAIINAQINFETAASMGASANPIFKIALDQLNNAVTAIENGKDFDWILQENMFGDVNVGDDQ